MGLSIHYSGRFNPAASLEEMIEEVKDVANVNHWPYHIFETAFDPVLLHRKTHNQKIYGILFTPPQCESVELSFLSNGRMSGVALLQFWGHSKKKEEQQYLYGQWVKTQFAGMEVHKIIVHLLKHISKKYLLDFKVTDEGHYWETGDEKLLAETFGKYTLLINQLSTAFETIPINPEEWHS
ncbi:MAG: hypothetical protein ABI729_03280, partial [Chitinophagales bacterium]